MLIKIGLPEQHHLTAGIKQGWYLDAIGTDRHLRALYNSMLHNFQFSCCWNRCIVNWLDQFFLICVCMRTTLINSYSLVPSWRRLQFSFFSGCLFLVVSMSNFLAPPLLGSWLSKTSHQVNLMQFSFRWLVSLQYQQVNAGSREPSTPGANCDGCGFPR